MNVNERLQGFIRDADLRRVRITVIYGKRDMQDREREWISGLTTSAETWFVPNLHAKCYLSEDAAIITSMNLYEFAQRNNDEMGIYVSRSQEPALYKKSGMKPYGYVARPLQDKALQLNPRLQLLPTNRRLPNLTNRAISLATVFVAGFACR